jgi:hypothetical protein
METTIHITKEAIELGRLENGFSITVSEDGYVIRRDEPVRKGWEEDFVRMHQAGDDKIIFKDDLNNIADWTW